MGVRIRSQQLVPERNRVVILPKHEQWVFFVTAVISATVTSGLPLPAECLAQARSADRSIPPTH